MQDRFNQSIALIKSMNPCTPRGKINSFVLRAGVIQPVKQDVIQTEIDDRFQALESEIKAIREELKAIVNAGNSPQKT